MKKQKAMCSVLGALVILIQAGCSTDQNHNITQLSQSSERDADYERESELALGGLRGRMGKKYRVTVRGGHGGGEYTAGERVFVWSSATSQDVSLPWSGDRQLLQNPDEWATSFEMPARDVHLEVKKESMPAEFKMEKFLGAGQHAKNVYFHFPKNMRGVVLISHGTGGDSGFVLKTEPLAVANTLIKNGYGIISSEAEEVAHERATKSDLNGDGKIRWSTALKDSNVDLKNIDLLFASFQDRGFFGKSTPRFALGMSNGGAFSGFLGAISGTRLAPVFPNLRFNSVAIYCADASGSSLDQTVTPTAWYMCGKDDNKEVSNSEAKTHHESLKKRGVRTRYLVSSETPLFDERFARIKNVSTEQSRLIAAELRAAGFTKADGFFSNTTEEIEAVLANEGNRKKFPTFLSLSFEAQLGVRSQIDVMNAAHAMYSDYAQNTLRFFEDGMRPKQVAEQCNSPRQ